MPIQLESLTLYTAEELSEKLDITPQSIYAMLRDGRLKGRKMAKKWYITEEAVRDYFGHPEPEIQRQEAYVNVSVLVQLWRQRDFLRESGKEVPEKLIDLIELYEHRLQRFLDPLPPGEKRAFLATAEILVKATGVASMSMAPWEDGLEKVLEREVVGSRHVSKRTLQSIETLQSMSVKTP